ncbi:Oidioi.mRNA.OKI2018_I69.chr2.g4996.t1.cds [Oikopleura dioica]|uniref:Oidioi.mRNA.OKI2018_I69.chr2.g4996.t1.cds n=1 Tax=Oikopleura dioica TaxID=34765 RepID=A0ABN7SZI5_OIKDI|nr:Oidioi.mRNA.OKI2018_I69.chr2.g4996.t1.cds [Oikopleura dioica]
MSIFKVLFTDFEEELTNLRRIFARRCLIICSISKTVVILLILSGICIKEEEEKGFEIFGTHFDMDDPFIIDENSDSDEQSIPELFAAILTMIVLFLSTILSTKIVIFNLSKAAFGDIQALENELNVILSDLENVIPEVNDEPPKYDELARAETPPPEYSSINPTSNASTSLP